MVGAEYVFTVDHCVFRTTEQHFFSQCEDSTQLQTVPPAFSMQYVYIAVFCLLAFTIHAGAGLRCWSCTSSGERHCGDPFNRTYFRLTECDRDRSAHTYNQPTYAACKKSKQLVNGEELVIRSCVWDKESACIPSSVHSSVKDVFCETCTEDGCNGAQRFRTSAMVLLPSILWVLAAKIL